MPTDDELRSQNEELRSKIEQLEAIRGRSRRDQIIEAAREVAKVKGFDADLREILHLASVSTTTFYRYFQTREEVIAELVRRLNQRAVAKTSELLEVEDGKKRILEWMCFAFGQYTEYGILSNEIAIGEVPSPYTELVDSSGMWRFVGRTVRDCKAQGHCRTDVDTRVVVRTYVWLVQPFRMNWCRRDGMTDEEIMAETMEIFFHAFAADPPKVAA